MKRNDFILVFSILLISVFISFSYSKINGGHNEGNKAYVYVDGDLKNVLMLDEDTEYPLDTEFGYNLIVITDRRVYMKEADCPGRDCIKMGGISKPGEIISCLPHRLLIEIKGDESKTVDTVAY